MGPKIEKKTLRRLQSEILLPFLNQKKRKKPMDTYISIVNKKIDSHA
jgi:hypothetical protein